MRISSRLYFVLWMYAGLVLFTFGGGALALLGYALASFLVGEGGRQFWVEDGAIWTLRFLSLVGVWWLAVLASRRPTWASVSPWVIAVMGGGTLVCGVGWSPVIQRVITTVVEMPDDVANDLASLCALVAFGVAVFAGTFVRVQRKA